MIDPFKPDYENTPAAPGRPGFGYVRASSDEPPVVSVVSSFFNTPPPAFRETSLSLMRQSFQQWEWIIVNDGSTSEAALDGLKPFRDLDRRIRVVDLPANEGPSEARNVGFREATTDYVVMLDSDDMLEPTAIEKWLWYLHTHPEASFVDSYAVGFGAQRYLWNLGSRVRERNLVDNLITSVMVMIRRDVWRSVGGFDPTLRTGCEDWDFWLKCAAAGRWGDTVPEYLAWYRRRKDHSLSWPTWTKEGIEGARREWRRRYPRLYAGGFPRLEPAGDTFPQPVTEHLPADNLLAKPAGTVRLLLVLPKPTTGNFAGFPLDAMVQLAPKGYEITICATEPDDVGWVSRFAAVTPDVFSLPAFLELWDYPRFLYYMVRSRGIDIVVVSNSLLGYRLIPYLRSRCPDVVFVDFDFGTGSAGHPRGDYGSACGFQGLFDLTVQDEAAGQGIDGDRTSVCRVAEDSSAGKLGDSLNLLLGRARRLAHEHPLPAVEPGMGLECANLAVACACLDRYSRNLWADHVKERHDARYRETSPVYAVRHLVAVALVTMKQAVCHPKEFLARTRRWLMSFRRNET